VYRMVKWVLVSTVALGSMAQAESGERGLSPDKYTHILTVDVGGERKSITVSRLPTGRVLPPPKSTPPTPPSKPTLPPPPPPKQTLPPTQTLPPKQTPPPPKVPLPPPVTHSPPPVTNSPPPVQPPPVTHSLPPPSPTPAPEIDVRFGFQGIALLLGGLLVIRGGRSRRFAG
jgi:hypothetical protein